MKILITGGLGYIGSFLLDYLSDFEITVVDNIMFSQNYEKIIRNRFKFENVDVNDLEKMKFFLHRNKL